ncbi:RnfABCDGE type electron transport complex subunit G [Desulfoluna sp.]|uniref:RnfABCDGE type electron transport complex subunit G n=1 Tax=Desulfoluna sp. TaxID=2045199 RepID=UPI00260482DF|nr:RnfABCDGE type electron transport complex subunit G [Desulfoluna sp.]
MNDMFKMVLVLAVFTAVSGGVLAGVRGLTMDRIEYQQLKFQKEPVIRAILADAENDPMNDRFKIKDGEVSHTIFPGKIGDQNIVTLEAFGKGFAGNVGLLVAFDLDNDTIVGSGVTISTETPGFGSKAKEDPSFVAQFEGSGVDQVAAVSKDGGSIDAISGATITSRAVCVAVNEANAVYKRLKPELSKSMDNLASQGGAN